MTDREWLRAAIELSRQSPAAPTAYSVGAIVVDGSGVELARGFSRETDPHIHAEESALSKLGDRGAGRAGVTLYSSLEPCTTRRSRPRSCTELILAAGIRRVVFALREPPLFADCHGVEQLTAAGAEVIELTELTPLVRDINAHVFASHGGAQS